MRYYLNKSDDIIVRIAKKKFYNSQKRKRKHRNQSQSGRGEYNDAEIYRKSKIRFTNDIEKFCSLNKLHIWATISSTIKLDDDFALSKNTDRVLKDLLILLRHAKTLTTNPRLIFNGHVSFGALFLIDTLCWEIGKKRQWVVNHPTLPDEEIKILRSLKSNVASSFEDDNEYLINQPVRINRTTGDMGNQPYHAKAKEITDMLEKAIKETKKLETYRLPFDVAQGINSTIGEQFDNINLHAIDTEIGTLCGFYNKNRKEISILIFNFGPTLFQSLSAAEFPPTVEKFILTMLQKFDFDGSEKLFKQKNNHTIESIFTLLAVQEGISSKLMEDDTRGHGLIDFIESVKKINAESKITIVSGNVALYLNQSTEIKNSFLIDRVRKLITLNNEGELLSKPNSENIKNLKYTFPGVLIETVIPLEEI